MFKFICSKIKFLIFSFCFKKLVVETAFNISVNLLSALLIVALSWRESVNSKFSLSVFAYPPAELLFFTLLKNSSIFILPLNVGVCFMLNFLRAFPYFLTQLYTVAGQISALSYSLKCLLTSLKGIPLFLQLQASAIISGLCFIFQKPSFGTNRFSHLLHQYRCFLPDLL